MRWIAKRDENPRGKSAQFLELVRSCTFIDTSSPGLSQVTNSQTYSGDREGGHVSYLPTLRNNNTSLSSAKDVPSSSQFPFPASQRHGRHTVLFREAFGKIGRRLVGHDQLEYLKPAALPLYSTLFALFRFEEDHFTLIPSPSILTPEPLKSMKLLMERDLFSLAGRFGV